ncbi:isoleucine--tRNA ligase [Pseudochryseolinea flava]|uniref:Isoleucine--tRNA ligase n=1 Tax=Pseudochryseolinea flava TaxID=2059302 RepID=A0A364Y756_9BACT|nr:isoleucine--tRNA ligase [Pseudochryseolinea flava]RAW02780.1 isoleucine--tRNA ligase [Pseudochryseolinea flava]
MAGKYQEFKELNFAKIASEILDFWKAKQVFEKSVSNREGAQTFTFYEGPPSANGTPGIHHVMARTVKDIFCRYKTLQGFQVKRKGGWDTHGLPVELQVEKQLGITKDDIGKKISIEEYNQKCRETVMMYKDQWDDLTMKMGYWVDLENPYITYEKEYIESLWWILKQFYNKGLLYKGYTIQPYSPSDGTGLSSHELNQPGCYKEVKDTSIVAQFKVKRDAKSEFLFSAPKGDVFVLAWTTTPWTLPSNTALAVGEKITYVQVNTYNAYTHLPISVVMAKDLVGKYFSEKNKDLKLEDYKKGDKAVPFQVVQEFTGKQLVGIAYEQLMPYLLPAYDADKAFRVIAGDFVTTEDGTGVVHTSPTFGADDFRVAKQNGIPGLTVKDDAGNEMPTVDKKGKFINVIGEKLKEGVAKFNIKTHKPLNADDFYVKNYTDEDENHPDYKTTDVIISIILKEENKAFDVRKYEHTYPHSWRTDKPVLYYPLDAWFIKTTAVKDKMVKLNKDEINWKPESTGTGRFGNWLENLVDWNLSRSRYWGTPLPIWRSKDGQEEICIGSIAELNTEVAKAVKAGLMKTELAKDFDLHRPYVDDIVLVSSTGQAMYREPDLIDVWFDSGAMPYAQWHYPFENKDIFAKSYPADFIAEGVDQTRGWFFTLHAIAAMLSESSDEIKAVNKQVGNGGVAFKNVISNGLVLDKNGEKMSKRKGNVVNPFEALPKYGADIVRWYMIENAPPWDNLKFDMDGITEVQRRFFGTLMNTYSFFALYANVDGFVKDEMNNVPHNNLTHLDRWIISKLQSLVIETTKAYEEYEPTRAARAIQDFVNDHLSNWYVRLNRKRFWKGEMSEDKKAAYETLYTCLLVADQLMSPIAPFYAEWLYKNLTDNIRDRAVANKTPLRHESVHLTDLVKPETQLIDVELEKSMEYAQRICSLVHSIRKNAKVKVRTPLQRILLPVLDNAFANRIKSVEEIILAEVNVKHIEYIDDTSGIVVKKVKPNLPKLGKQYGPKMKEVSTVISAFTKEDIAAIEKQGKLSKDGFDLVLEDVLISSEDIPGWSVASEAGLTVALDITITEALKKEGIARDFVNRVQNIRKDMGLEILDKINIEVEKDGEVVTAALTEFKEYISTETQALSLELKENLGNATEVDMDEFMLKVKVSVKK